MKKIIVTGGSGFIGSNLVKFLMNKNYFVINIDNLSYSANPYNLKKISNSKKYKFYKVDINNEKAVLKIEELWNIIKKERIEGYEHRAAKKRRTSTNELSSSPKPGVCLIRLDENGNII